MQKKIYIAGKLNDMAVDYLHNVHKMMTVAEEVRKAGYSVFVPAIDLLMGIKFGYKSYEDYFNNSQPWLAASDAVFLVEGWDGSECTEREIELAEELGIPVFTKLDQMNTYFKVFEDLEKGLEDDTNVQTDKGLLSKAIEEGYVYKSMYLEDSNVKIKPNEQTAVE